jgi:DNA-binding MarR family transcriptional regulator
MDHNYSELVVALGAELNALLVAFRTVTATSAARFQPDLQPAAFQIAMTLSRGPAKAGRLAKQLGMDKSAVSRLAKSLCDSGLATASADPNDGRGIVYSLTDDGIERLHAANAIKSDVYFSRIEGWSDGELARFTNLLRKFNKV